MYNSKKGNLSCTPLNACKPICQRTLLLNCLNLDFHKIFMITLIIFRNKNLENLFNPAKITVQTFAPLPAAKRERLLSVAGLNACPEWLFGAIITAHRHLLYLLDQQSNH
jgi:hypothetical protein